MLASLPVALSFAPAPMAPRALVKAAMPAVQPLMSAADGMGGKSHEFFNQVWDPLGLADLGSPATLAFMRHAELKHGRVAMAAFLGWLVATGNALAISNGHAGLHFDGLISFSEGVSFADLAKQPPLEQWASIPAFGKFQIIAAIGIIEHQNEWKCKPHYMAPGGVPGSYKGLKAFWDPVGLTSKFDAKRMERQRLSEIKNGRAAMLGIVSVLIASNIPGAIPVPIDFPAGAAFISPF